MTLRILLTFALGLLITAAQAQRTLTLAAEDDWAPYSSMKADRSGVEGLSPDLVRAAFRTQDIEVNFLVVPFSRCLMYAETGRVAGCFNATITEANRNTYHWHATPLFHEDLAIFARSDAARAGLTEKHLEGKLVGITAGYTYPTSFMTNPRITRQSANSDANLLNMLAAGRVEYILLNTMPGYMRIANTPALQGRVKLVGTLQTDGFWIAFSKQAAGGEALAATFEQGLLAIKASGEYDRITTRFRRQFGL
ncbi:transporter substrate-binding domain-containing protein [Aquincola sp. MAHUQ-54]|uniref:Transporter substrate-binding domain-containing protein n=2 Tax=Aquincola agrisoli TaxID=3119538 RepID=A0AAW9Q2Z3_9BURK